MRQHEILLFQMVGVSKVPTFGEALEVAKSAAALVNLRPAFLLAEISQESAIGKNVGQCMITDLTSGNGKKVSSGAARYGMFLTINDKGFWTPHLKKNPKKFYEPRPLMDIYKERTVGG